MAISVASDNPSQWMLKLSHEDGDRFRRDRDDSDIPGEVWQFETDEAGTVTGVTFYSNTSDKIQ